MHRVRFGTGEWTQRAISGLSWMIIFRTELRWENTARKLKGRLSITSIMFLNTVNIPNTSAYDPGAQAEQTVAPVWEYGFQRRALWYRTDMAWKKIIPFVGAEDLWIFWLWHAAALTRSEMTKPEYRENNAKSFCCLKFKVDYECVYLLSERATNEIITLLQKQVG